MKKTAQMTMWGLEWLACWRGPWIESQCLHRAFLAGLNLNAGTLRPGCYAVSQALSLALSDWIQTQSREDVLG